VTQPSLGGLLIVDKPMGMTSHDVVSRVRRLAGTRRVGHAGTLDPMATGVLVLGIDRATRLLTFLVGHDKEYEAVIRLGASTVTDDVEGEVIEHVDASGVDEAMIRDVVRQHLTGPIEQRPSAVSAIKIDGKRAYARVRAGDDVVLPARAVTVHSFKILEINKHDATVDVTVAVCVSSGTYVRALARDLGAVLGVGGHLTRLRRTRSGPFSTDDAVALDDLDVTRELIPLSTAVQMCLGRIDVPDDQVSLVRNGRRIAAPEPCPSPVGVFGTDGEVLSVARVEGGVLVPDVVFAGG
jgi:tRNA pseudouridine55 synthase